MAIPVIMPRQGQSVETCLFSSWHVQKGSRVRKGDLLFSYETDKAAFDAEAPEDGTLLETWAQPGEEIPVLQHIAVIGEPGESIDHLRPGDLSQAQSSSDKPGKSGESKSITIETEAARNTITGAAGFMAISPRAKKAAKKKKVDTGNIAGSGPEGRIIERDILKKASELPRATPLAKSIAYTDHIELPKEGSGSGGRILSSDLKNTAGGTNLEYEDKPISNIRRIIAKNMLASMQNTAQLTLHTSADARIILELRKKYKKLFEEEGHINITLNDLVCFAIVRALEKHSFMNAHFLGETTRNFNTVHLGIAVDAPRGLMVPTLRNAGRLSLTNFSTGLKELASKARKGDIDPELLSGATFTVTNLGGLGVEIFTPVLNPPQVGILGINNIQYRPEDIGNGIIAIIPVIGLSLTFDHRAVDGAPAAVFLKEVADQIRNLEIN